MFTKIQLLTLIVIVTPVVIVKSLEQHRIEPVKLDSQMWSNGTTTINKYVSNTSVKLQYNDVWNHGVPLFNYSSAFNMLRNASANEDDTTDGYSDLGDVNNCVRKITQECEDDKIQLDFLLSKTASLEIELLKMESTYNFTVSQLQECKTKELLYQRSIRRASYK